MPNWCINEVDISFHRDCPMEERLRIRKAINIPLEERNEKCQGNWKEEDNWFSFKIIVPEPKHKIVEVKDRLPEYVLENGEDYDWYHWRYDNWGVKWDRSDIYFSDNDELNISMSFDTPWNPPEGVHNKVREILDDYASMTWFYRESGCEIAGYLQ